jgi:phosphoribosylamine--glycine ligase
MGVFCPATNIDGKMLAKVEREVLVPAIDALRRDDIAFRGVLYAGIMLTPAGPKVLEFNCRFGDPECQAILPRLESDALELLYAAAAGKLDKIDIQWNNDATCCVVLASEGYPEKPVNGQTITGLADAAKVPGVTIYHAGTKRESNGVVKTDGGRVLNVVARGPIAEVARERAYEAVSRIKFAGMQYRNDIG